MRTAGERIDIHDMRRAGKVRDRFEHWLSAAPLPALLAACEARAWRDTQRMRTAWRNRARKVMHSDILRLWRLDRADVASVRAAAIAAIEAAGGRVELGATVVTVVGGELRISMA